MAVEKITIPDFGDVQEIRVVEVFIAVGDVVEKEGSLIALESEKAVMDLPSPFSGKITEVLVKEEAVVNSGDVIALIEVAAGGGEKKAADDAAVAAPAAEEKKEPSAAPASGGKKAAAPAANAAAKSAATKPPTEAPVNALPPSGPVHATPSVRALAREQGIDLSRLSGSGPFGRITREDLLAAQSGAAMAMAGPVAPAEDFSRYGPVEEVPLGRIQKISGPHLQRSWQIIPHVTHFDEADITGLEAFRKELNAGLAEGEAPFSPLVFVIRAVTATLKAFPTVNSSLQPDGAHLVRKSYYHIGIAVDTDGGLVVPVIRDADGKGFRALAGELRSLSSKAREGKLAINDLQGASFTISSLGGIGGTGFTPIVNGPQVGILGLSRSSYRPVWDGGAFVPRLILPFSLSYDHRVVDGAVAARGRSEENHALTRTACSTGVIDAGTICGTMGRNGARRRARRLYSRVSRRRSRPFGLPGRGAQAPRRGLPQCRLHPVEDPAPRSRAAGTGRGGAGLRDPLRRAGDRSRRHAGQEG